jgi:NAD(P)H-dependent FMN reductase
MENLLTSSEVEVLPLPESAIKAPGVSSWQHGDSTFASMLSTIALFSSARRLGNTGRLVDRVAAELGIGVIDLAGLHIGAYDYDHLNRNDDFEPLMQRVLAHDQVIFATPIYWSAVSPGMKIFLDRLSDLLELPDLLASGRRLRGKNAYVVCTSINDEPSAAFVGAFRETFEYLGMQLAGVAHANCPDGYLPARHDPPAVAFAALVLDAALNR